MGNKDQYQCISAFLHTTWDRVSASRDPVILTHVRWKHNFVNRFSTNDNMGK